MCVTTGTGLKKETLKVRLSTSHHQGCSGSYIKSCGIGAGAADELGGVALSWCVAWQLLSKQSRAVAMVSVRIIRDKMHRPTPELSK